MNYPKSQNWQVAVCGLKFKFLASVSVCWISEWMNDSDGPQPHSPCPDFAFENNLVPFNKYLLSCSYMWDTVRCEDTKWMRHFCLCPWKAYNLMVFRKSEYRKEITKQVSSFLW